MANIYDVAKEANVSIAAVSLVVSDPETPRVGKVKRTHIIETAARLGYTPNALAKALSKGSSKIIGLVIPLRDPIFFNMFIAQTLAGIQASLVTHGYHLMIYSHNAHSGRITAAELLQSRYVDGVIVLNTRLCSDLDIKRTIQDLRKARIPFVMTNCYAKARGINYVGADDAGIGRLAAGYLADKGHRHVAVLGGASISPMSSELLNGFVEEWKRRKGKWSDRFYFASEYDEALIPVALASWMKRARKPTAIFCADDQLVPGLYRELSQLGLNVPEDIAVLGRGDLGLASLVQPQLSTIAVPAFQMGKEAADLLIKSFAAPDGEPTRLILPSAVVERAST